MTKTILPSEIDTIVVPARKKNFQEQFIKKNCWYAIRIHKNMIPKIKYIAAYQTAPESAITHFAPVKLIEQWKDWDRYIVHFAEPASKIGPITIVEKRKGLQGLRYTTREKLLSAKTLDDAF